MLKPLLPTLRLLPFAGWCVLALPAFSALADGTPPPPKPTPATEPAPSPAARDGSHDFDFEFGSWTVEHRQKRSRTGEWITFTGTSSARPVLGGLGNVEDNVLNAPRGTYRGLAVRDYDPAKKTWAIYWVDTNNPHTLGGDPLIGSFVNGVGTFYADTTDANNKPLKVRFLWHEITEDSATWEQAFSTDAGATWDTSWVMHFKRVG